MIDVYIVYSTIFLVLLLNSWQFFKSFAQTKISEKSIFILFIFSILGWLTANFISDVNKNYAIALLGAELAILFAPNMATSVFLVSQVFPQVPGARMSRKRLPIIPVIAMSAFITLIGLLFLNSPLNIQEFHVNPTTASDFTPGPLYVIVLGYAFLMIFATLVYWYSNRKSYTWLQNQQVQLLSLSLIFLVISLSIGFVLFPAIGQASLTPLSFLPVTIYLSFIQTNVFSKRYIVNSAESITSFAIQIVFSISVLILLYFVEWLLGKGITIIPQFLVIYMLYNTIHFLSDYIRIRLTSKKIEEKVLQFIERTTSTLDTASVIDEISKTIKQVFPSATTSIEFSTTTHNVSLYELVEVFWQKNKKNSLITKEYLIDIMNQGSTGYHRVATNLFKEMSENGLTLIVPLKRGSRLQAILIIKEEKLSLDVKTASYIDLLAHNASIALSRSTLYERVQSFADDLSRKVKERTKELEESKMSIQEKNLQLRNAFHELKTLDNAKSEFISIASHQLRTPISIIKGYLSMILEGDFGGMPEPQLIALHKAADNIQQLNDIVEDILNASRIERGKMAISPDKTEIIELVKSVAEQLQPKAEKKQLKLIYKGGVKEFTTLADRNKIYEVIINLVDNAINYTKEGSVTVVTDTTPEGDLLIVVKDTGIGIPDKFKDKMFQRFSRSENAKTIRPDGTGIGLYVAKSFIDAHQGQIWFESTLNVGTTFYIKLLKNPVFLAPPSEDTVDIPNSIEKTKLSKKLKTAK